MFKNLQHIKTRLVLIAVLALSIASAYAQNPVAANGALKVSGGKLVNSSGNPIQLRGMSFFWSQWDPYFWTGNTVKVLHDDWKCNAVRTAVGIEKADGYKTNKQANLTKIYNVIDAAIASGMYVVIDAHSYTAYTEVETIKDLFTTIITKYKAQGKLQHLLYETYNEPTNPTNEFEGGKQSWEKEIKPYHEVMVKHIRSLDPNGVILLGTEEWDTLLSKALASSVSGTNIMYVFHYYAAQHLFSGRSGLELQGAVAAKQPVFVTEYGTVMAPGNGSVNVDESNKYWDFLDKNMISYMNWSMFNKDTQGETASAIKGSVNSLSAGTSGLTQSGALVRAHYIARNAVDPIDKAAAVTGVESEFEVTSSLATPNPSSNNFTITQSGTFNYTVSDVTGKVMTSGTGVESAVVGESLPAGSYILSVESGSTKKVAKLLKN